MTNSQPIGIFDSGIGGLSVARAIRELLPSESLIYVADSGHAPYGDKTDTYIYQRMQAITQHLLSCQVKAIVVACNTATTAAIGRLRADCPLPVFGVEPGVKPAVLASKTGVVGVLATPRTLLTPAFDSLRQRFAGQAKVILQPCPQLVPQIETLELDGLPMREMLTRYIQPLFDQGADTLVLGCTHYNFIADLIADIAGPDVTIVRTEPAVAKQVQHRLTQTMQLNTLVNAGTARFYSSGDISRFNQQLRHLWPDASQPAAPVPLS
ncbi:glutamate racemase [Alteromonas halophila]|uniref:Glutamate racemase n=1 Tax=Alteromonas halophila TaxID=516698 RepID=A0A918JEW2_9ALTE|nr:glutamate racemase [Alteromonas halophila]GGW76743.1 glutamate racemase [Alteromonas halophila]